MNGSEFATTYSTSYTFYGLASDTTYTLGVKGVNSYGSSSVTTTSGTTLVDVPTVPLAPDLSSLSVTSTDTTVTLSWSPSSGATSYRVILNGSYYGTTNSTYFTYTGLEPLTTYYIGVAASNTAGTSSYSPIIARTRATTLLLNNPIDVDLVSDKTRVYAFTPPSTGVYSFYTGSYGGSGTLNDTMLDLYEDDQLANQITSNDDASGNTLFSEIKRTLQGGVTYYIKLSGYETTAVHARITVTTETSSIPPLALNAPEDISASQAGDYVVYQFTPAQSGEYEFSTNYYGDSPSSPDNDTVMSVFSDYNQTDLIGYNDDMDGSLFSNVKLSLIANHTYFIMVENYAGDPIYTRLLATMKQQVSYATLGNQQSVDVSLPSYRKAYYQFTPSASGHYRFFSSPFQGQAGLNDTVLELYADAALTTLLSRNDDALDIHPYGEVYSKIDYTLTQGTTYYVVLRNYGSASLKARLTVEDDFDNTKNSATSANWDQIYLNNRISSLYDVNYYKVVVTERQKVHIGVSKNSLMLEDNQGNILGIYDQGNSDTISLSPGIYFIRAQYISPTQGVSELSVGSFTGYNFDFSGKVGSIGGSINPQSINIQAVPIQDYYGRTDVIDATPRTGNVHDFVFKYDLPHQETTIDIHMGRRNDDPIVYSMNYNIGFAAGPNSISWGGGGSKPKYTVCHALY
ncbi:hypothetical protein J2736_004980 [Paenibacillus qinlingensis]|uniref:Fibronectin type-III domain-containing protein n=1 Tax=Paenibacillus qinlingensis TaxID=1837343 RepID=A0ABU1P200_9BACL|nr:hypothetical protein [Paenibacillus qinlingensis]